MYLSAPSLILLTLSTILVLNATTSAQYLPRSVYKKPYIGLLSQLFKRNYNIGPGPIDEGFLIPLENTTKVHYRFPERHKVKPKKSAMDNILGIFIDDIELRDFLEVTSGVLQSEE